MMLRNLPKEFLENKIKEYFTEEEWKRFESLVGSYTVKNFKLFHKNKEKLNINFNTTGYERNKNKD